jgi:hypothetical protein
MIKENFLLSWKERVKDLRRLQMRDLHSMTVRASKSNICFKRFSKSLQLSKDEDVPTKSTR